MFYIRNERSSPMKNDKCVGCKADLTDERIWRKGNADGTYYCNKCYEDECV